MVMVSRSLEAANAITAGKSISLIVSATMSIPSVDDGGAGDQAGPTILRYRSLRFG
jgi:hypothetical protein